MQLARLYFSFSKEQESFLRTIRSTPSCSCIEQFHLSYVPSKDMPNAQLAVLQRKHKYISFSCTKQDNLYHLPGGIILICSILRCRNTNMLLSFELCRLEQNCLVEIRVYIHRWTWGSVTFSTDRTILQIRHKIVDFKKRTKFHRKLESHFYLITWLAWITASSPSQASCLW